MNKFKNRISVCMVLVTTVIALFVSPGCHYFYDQVGEEKRIPSPISDEFPYEIEGKIYRVWVANELQIKTDLHTTYLILEGVNNPDMDAATEAAAVEYFYTLFESENVRAVVFGLDERKRAVAQVYSGETNFNLKMIRSGWARYDGTDFDQADVYRAAERKAKDEKLGIWQN